MDNGNHQRFSNLGSMIDEIHALFEYWENAGIFSPAFDADKVQLMKLAVHEWVANLIQHADFAGRIPDVKLDVYPNGSRVRCVIVDNSDGFDLGVHLDERRRQLSSLPERGMGLLMLNAATE